MIQCGADSFLQLESLAVTAANFESSALRAYAAQCGTRQQ